MQDARIDHVAVAVRSIAAALPFFMDTLGASFLFAGDEPGQGFRWAQFRYADGTKFELVMPLRPDSFVARFLEGRGEGVHHVTLKVDDIHAAIAHLRANGADPFNISLEHDDWKEAFLHPKDSHGVLVQIAQARLSDEAAARHHLAPHDDDDHRHVSLDELRRDG